MNPENAERQNAQWWENFRNLLDDQNDWPEEYLFKFIVPRAGLEQMKRVFGRHHVKVRASAKGNYVSVTAKLVMNSSEEVIAIYTAAADVEGVVSL